MKEIPGFIPKEQVGPDIVRFSPESRVALESAGFRIINLTGESISEMQTEGERIILRNIDWRNTQVPGLRTRRSEVAYRPGMRVDRGMGGLTASRGAVEITGIQLRSRLSIEDIDTIIGNAADNARILIDHERETGELLNVRSRTFPTIRTGSGYLTRRVAEKLTAYPNVEGYYLSTRWAFRQLPRYYGTTFRGTDPSIDIRPHPGDFIMPIIVPTASLSEKEIKARNALYTRQYRGSNPFIAYGGSNVIEGIYSFWKLSDGLFAEYEENKRRRAISEGRDPNEGKDKNSQRIH